MKTHFARIAAIRLTPQKVADVRSPANFDAFQARKSTIPEVIASLNAAFPDEDGVEECSFENAGLNMRTL